MRIMCTLMLLGFFTSHSRAQWDLPVTFEKTNEVENWKSFANNDLPEDLQQVENPDRGGLNLSDSCCRFTIDSAAGQFVGAWSNVYGYTAFTQSRHTMEIMVYSSDTLTVGVRGQNPLEPGENQYGAIASETMTRTDEWELLTLDLSASSGITYSTLTLFADINQSRTKGSVLYWDNLGWVEATSVDNASLREPVLYPNPVSDHLTVEYPGIKRITITNLVGQQVYDQVFMHTGIITIELSSLESGIYILSLVTEGGMVTGRFIKQ